MRVLVTGGAGFIGGHIVDALVAAGVEVVVLDNIARHAHRVDPDHLPSSVDLRRADLGDAVAVARAVEGVDAVSHQAARVGLGVDFGDVTDYVTDNDLGTAVLLDALWRGRFGGRLVVASSMVVYGEGAYRCADHGPVRPGSRSATALSAGRFEPPCPHCGAPLEPETITEHAPLDPRNTYAATKVHTEHLAAVFGRESGASVAALRYHNVYGPRMPRDTPYAGVASIFRSALEAGGRPRVNEDGGQRRDFVHVEDVARANLLALLEHPSPTGPFNIASGTPHTVGQLAARLADSFGDAEDRRATAPVVTGEWRLGDVRHVTASPDRAAAELGFEATVDFGDGMADFARAPLRP